MQKLQKLCLVRNSSKLYRETNNIFSINASQNEKNYSKKAMKWKSEPEILTEDTANENNTNKLMFYGPLVQFEIFSYLPKIQENMGFDFINLCTDGNRFLEIHSELGTSLIPSLYNSRAIIPYSKPSSNYTNTMIKRHDILKLTFQCPTENSHIPQSEEKANVIEGFVDRYPPKHALSLSETTEEMKEQKEVSTRNDVTIEISRNCSSCPAVVSIRRSPSKFLKRNLKKRFSNITNERKKGGEKKKASKIMIINDKIFKGRTVETMKNSCNISRERNSLIYLNNEILNELKTDKINKILNRKCSTYKDEEKDILTRIPTRRSSKKLKPIRTTDEKRKECHEIPLENLIAAVAENKRLEYIERSKMSWKAFKQLEKTLEKVKILNFSPQDTLQHHDEKNKNSELSKMNLTQIRKQKMTVQDMKDNSRFKNQRKTETAEENRTKEKKVANFRINPHQLNTKGSKSRKTAKFLKGISSKPPCRKEDVGTETKSNKGKSNFPYTLKTEIQHEMIKPINTINESRKCKTQIKTTDHQESKLKNKWDCGIKKSEKSEGLQNVKMDTSTMGKTLKKNTNPEKNEYNERFLLIKSLPTKTTHHEKSKMVDLAVTENESNTKEDKTRLIQKKMIQKISMRKNEPKKEKEPLREEGTPLIILHKNPMNSTISSSESEIIGSILGKPKMKTSKPLKSQNETSQNKFYSKDSVDEKGTKLSILDIFGSLDPPKIEKSQKSKLPILGTPTTIKNHIENVVATALATKNIREKFNEEKKSVNKAQEKSGIRIEGNQEKIKSDELKDEIRVENTDMLESENINNYVSESIKINSKSASEMGNIGENDKILEMNSSPVHRVSKKSTDNEMLQNNKMNKSLEENIKIVPTNKLDTIKIPNDNTGVKNINVEDKSIQMKSLKNKLKEKIVSISKNMNIEEQNNGIRGATEIENVSTQKQSEIHKKIEMNTPEDCTIRSNSGHQDPSIMIEGTKSNEKIGYRLGSEKPSLKRDKESAGDRLGMSTIIICDIERGDIKIDESIQNTKLLNENENDIKFNKIKPETSSPEKNMKKDENIKITFSGDCVKNEMKNINSRGELIGMKGTKHKEEFVHNNGAEIMKKTKEKSITNLATEIEDTKQYIDIVGNKQKGMKEKSTAETISTADPQIIRKKRLIYFKDKMNNTKLKETHCVEENNLKSDKTVDTTRENIVHIKNGSSSLQSRKSIAKSSETGFEKTVENVRIGPDQPSQANSLIENGKLKETQSSSSQYDKTSNIDRHEKAIETETIHKDAAVTDRNGSVSHETEATLKESVSDNIIVIKAAKTYSKERVQGITKSFLKQVQSRMSLVQNSKLKNGTWQKYREIAMKVKKSQEKFIRNIPSSCYNICNEARDKYKSFRNIRSRSKEIINKFTSTFPKNTIESDNQAELKNVRRSPNKSGMKVKSVIERYVTSEILLMTKPLVKNITKKKKLCNIEKKSKDVKQINQAPSTRSSKSELQNRSIGSLFADTVTSALAKCGDVDQIMSKYSDSLEKIPHVQESSRNLVQKYEKDTEVKEDEFLMSDGVRKLILNATVERNEDRTSNEEWKCYPVAVLVKKSNSEKQIAPSQGEKCIPINQAPSSSKLDTGLQQKSNISSLIVDDVSEYKVLSKNLPQGPHQNNATEPNLEDESNALEETKQGLTKLKVPLQEEKGGRNEDVYCQDQKIILYKNNESFYLKIRQGEETTPTSIEDLNKVLNSEMKARTAEGSTSPPPHPTAQTSIFQDKITNETISGDVASHKNINEHMDISRGKELETGGKLSFSTNSTAGLNNIEVIPQCLTDSCTDLTDDVFMTPLASNENFDNRSLEEIHILKGKVSEVLPIFDRENCQKVKSMEFAPNQGLTKNTAMLDKGKIHKILEKFARITEEPGTTIFKINNHVKFDRAKKTKC